MDNPNDHQHAIDVNIPVDVAYHRWAQFEGWPEFMDGVDTVLELGPDRLYWDVNIAGVRREFDTTVVEQVPNQRIAWRTTAGPDHAGVVTFHTIDRDTTRITLQMDFDPQGLLEHIGDKLGFITKRLETDMANFKALVENDTDPRAGDRRDHQPRP